MAAARCDWPDPLGPNSRMLEPVSNQASPVASAEMWARLTMGMAAKSRLSRVLRGGRRGSPHIGGRQAGLHQMSLDASPGTVGEFEFGQRCQQTGGRPALAVGAGGELLPHC